MLRRAEDHPGPIADEDGRPQEQDLAAERNARAAGPLEAELNDAARAAHDARSDVGAGNAAHRSEGRYPEFGPSREHRLHGQVEGQNGFFAKRGHRRQRHLRAIAHGVARLEQDDLVTRKVERALGVRFGGREAIRLVGHERPSLRDGAFQNCGREMEVAG